MSFDLRLHETVERVLQVGITPLPLCRPTSGGCSVEWHDDCGARAGKRPLIEGYPLFATQPPAVDVVRRWFRKFPSPNLGIVIPEGLMGLDADSVAAAQEAISLAQSRLTTPTRLARPGRGPVWLFRSPPGCKVQRATKSGASRAIDILVPGGILVIPPSAHQTGHVYEWATGMALWEVPVQWLPTGLKPLLEERASSPPSRGTPMGIEVDGGALDRVLGLIQAKSGLRHLWDGYGKRFGKDMSASGYDFALALELLKLGVKEPLVAAAIAQRPHAHQHTRQYVTKTVEKAAAKLRGGR